MTVLTTGKLARERPGWSPGATPEAWAASLEATRSEYLAGCSLLKLVQTLGAAAAVSRELYCEMLAAYLGTRERRLRAAAARAKKG